MPTPADLAAHLRRPLTAAPPPAGPPPSPGAFAGGVPFRQRWESGIRRSGLHRNARLIGLTIATYADWQTGVIPPLDHPSITRLSMATALGASNVRVSLHSLAGAGWIERTDCADDAYASRIQLLIPRIVRTRA